MSFLGRLFSSDRRKAISAEATGDFELAAERFALAGQFGDVVRMHLALANKAASRKAEIESLRDALHFCERAPEKLPQVQVKLGKALLAKADTDGVRSEVDKERVKEAAELLQAGQAFVEAGQAFASIDDTRAAAEAFRLGGSIGLLEATLNRQLDDDENEGATQSALADFELFMGLGQRDQALAALKTGNQGKRDRPRLQQRIQDLESRLLVEGTTTLKVGKSKTRISCGSEITLGRDSLCQMRFRTGGVSRVHTKVWVGEEGFFLSDAGSRNGTKISGLAISGKMQMQGEGEFSLGDHVKVRFQFHEQGSILELWVDSGLDSGSRAFFLMPKRSLDLELLEVPATLYFRKGRPILVPTPESFLLEGRSIHGGEVQLIRGDRLTLASVEMEVL